MRRSNTKLMHEILSYKRPAGSNTEYEVIARFIDAVPGMKRDGFGNRFIRIGDTTTMISCHTDTVHAKPGRQSFTFNKGIYALNLPRPAPVKKSKKYAFQESWWKTRTTMPTPSHDRIYGECLGADDGAGMFIALNMIAAGRPGLYVFHRAEEKGGKGASFITANHPDLTDGILRCIAFDRRGQRDIITHQAYGRCASDEFAESLAGLLEMGHSPDPTGSFTDSANYTDLIGECTNVSVGYENEHTDSETLDSTYLTALTDTLCHVDLESLPTVRKPGEEEWEALSFYADSVAGMNPATPAHETTLEFLHHSPNYGIYDDKTTRELVEEVMSLESRIAQAEYESNEDIADDLLMDVIDIEGEIEWREKALERLRGDGFDDEPTDRDYLLRTTE